ncbi:MAG: 4-alpha-glucanotransferase [Planctomycetia bacterium]|nr:4-alpha-glucanotransferase [Planctomycetia bacterium]
MGYDPAITDEWGICHGFYDIVGQFHPITPENRAKLLRAMGAAPDGSTAPPDQGMLSTWVVPLGGTVHFPDPGVLRLENGAADRNGRTEIPVHGNVCDLPAGYHDYVSGPPENRRHIQVIVVPERCETPPRCWGISLQVYACRSAESWGIGDLRDLRNLLEWAKSLGAEVAMINPLTAAAPTLPQNPSPYYSSSRRFRNPLYICVEEAPGYLSLPQPLKSELVTIGTNARKLNDLRLIDRDQVFLAKDRALRILCDAFFAGMDERTEPDAMKRFSTFCEEWGRSLDEMAAWNLLARRHGTDWRTWPTKYRRPDRDTITELMEEYTDEIRYEKWSQWVADEQFARAAKVLPVIQDLPVGVCPDGVDAWAWQDCFAFDCQAGAPPDAFNPLGQRWGLPPMIPHRLRAAGYRPLVETLRAALRHSAGLRIDHVMGCFRLFWIPTGCEATDGMYVQYPHHDMLGIVRLEALRAAGNTPDGRAPFVIGEDLGTVEPSVRETLASGKILRFLLQIFDDRPQNFPELAMAMVTTHDLPTLAGLWTGADEQAMLKAIPGLKPGVNIESRNRVAETTGCTDPHTPVEDVIRAEYQVLGESPSRIVLVTIEDLLGIGERPNMPGTVDEWPNWRLAIPGGIERLKTDPLPRQIADILNRSRRKTAPQPQT